MENKTVLIVQARLTSIRFPNKILKKIGSQTLLEILLKRLKQSKLVDQIVLAIPSNKKNKIITKILKVDVPVFYGSENDVLDRYYKAAKKFKAKNIVRISGDCPFIDPEVIDKAVTFFKKNKFDYVSNTIKPTYPDGLDVEIFNFKSLEKSWKKAKTISDREHVTKYILNNKKFKKRNFKYSKNLSFLRLTIDEKIDFELIKKIYLIFIKKKNYFFGIKDIDKLYMSNKKIFETNMNIKRNEGSTLNSGQKLWKRAKEIIPGGNMLLSKRPEMYLPNMWPTYYKKAYKCFIWDLDGNKFTDMSLMSVGTNILGYSNKKINDAAIDAIKSSNMSSLNTPEEIFLTEKLLDMHPHFHMAKYARTGGEANAIAVRIARAASGRDKVAICGYHGWHDWYLSTNLNNSDKKGLLKDHLLPGLSTIGVPKNLKNTIYPFKYNDFESLEKICKKNKIGVIKMEIFRNFPPKKNFLEKVRKLATKKNIVLIFDECTSGFRETFGGLHLKYNVKPDMCILGKALGNGFPITVVIGKKEIMRHAQSTFISSTFWTEKTGYVAALKTLEIMEKTKSWKIISNKGKRLKKNLQKIGKLNGLNIFLSGLDSCPSYKIKSKNWNKYKTYISQELLKKNFLGANTTYMSVYHDNKMVNKYLNCLNKIFVKIKKCENGQLDIDNLLSVDECHTGFERLN